MAAYNNAAADSASYLCGGTGATAVLVILHRHHWLGRQGQYLLTVSYCGFVTSHRAVVDDFGNLVIVGSQ